MTTQEAMDNYIRRTGIIYADRYAMTFQELQAAYEMAVAGRIFDALLLTFRFGRAKGYRMAKNEVRRGKVN